MVSCGVLPSGFLEEAMLSLFDVNWPFGWSKSMTMFVFVEGIPIKREKAMQAKK